jgi:hypothetical protein
LTRGGRCARTTTRTPGGRNRAPRTTPFASSAAARGHIACSIFDRVRRPERVVTRAAGSTTRQRNRKQDRERKVLESKHTASTNGSTARCLPLIAKRLEDLDLPSDDLLGPPNM